ncbi:2-oxoacid:acceptor oxidoreductase family protein [bacterium]|nr:2-oxoacid:acceptor oxidoreductase family protein [bacterium]
MEQSIIIAGFGGQGVLLCGRLLANLFMICNKQVTWYPCYGSEMRGGAVNCEIVVSDEEVTSVHKDKCDILISLNDTSYNRFINQVKPSGTVIVNSSLVKNIKNDDDINFIEVPITDIALQIGNAKVANMVALGVLSKLYNDVDFSKLRTILEKNFSQEKQHLVDLNMKSFFAGANYDIQKGLV